jgi:hypothetical protein
MANENKLDNERGPRLNAGKGQQKSYQLTGTNPTTGEPLPPITATQEDWRTRKLGQQGYVKPADMPEYDGTTDSSQG